MLATTYGRPAMISDTLADQLLLSRELENIPVQVEHFDRGFASFTYSLSMITSTLYENSSHEDLNAANFVTVGMESRIFKASNLMEKIEGGDYQDLVRFESDLSAWEKSLPSYLRVPAVAELLALREVPLFDVQAVALRAR